MATATVSEIKSLDDVHYKSKVKLILLALLVPVVFVFAFIKSFPVGDTIKSQLKTVLKGTGCNPDFDEIRMEFFLPKLVITDLTLPAACLGTQGEALKLNFVNLNWHVISFSPFGTPLRLDTELAGQPLSLYYVVGFGQQTVRLKDQKLDLGRLEQFMGKFRMGGSVIVDMNLLMANKQIKDLSLKSVSHDFVIPSQSIEGLSLPALKVNDFYLEAATENGPRLSVSRLVLGDPNSPVRANLKGHVDLQKGSTMFSPLNITGEVAFSENFKQSLPLIDMMFQSFTQKDGFYQIKLGGTLGAPKLQSP
jgi:hypothetical protein